MFTEKEINFTHNLFAAQRVGLLDPHAAETCMLAKGIIQKMVENKDSTDCGQLSASEQEAKTL